MKTSKKDIYREYGIEYDGEKIDTPIGKFPPLLVNGNAKIGKGIYHFSTLPGKQIYSVIINGMSFDVMGTCPCNCPGCYAMTGNYRYESTIKSLAVKTILAREYPDFTRRAIMAQIKADNIRFIRIHASGDFFNSEYVQLWKDIANAFPGVTFWTYTKNRDAENAFNDIANTNIVKSVIPGKGFNFGHCDYILACYEYLKNAGKSVYICRCGIDKNQHCTNCKGCSKNEYVLFIEHSTEYKAEKDPLFPVLKQIIEEQAEQA